MKRRTRQGDRSRDEAREGKPARALSGDRRGARGEARSSASARLRKRRAVRFVALLFVLTACFNAWFFLSFAKSDTFQSFLSVNARAAAGVLSLCGEEVRATGPSIVSPKESLSVRRGCDGLQVMAFFVIAVLVWPLSVPFSRRALGVLAGVAALGLLNTGRVVSLYYILRHMPGWFDTMHIGVWQSAFLVAAVAGWLVWLVWASRPAPVRCGDA